jgi:hypothetical protein
VVRPLTLATTATMTSLSARLSERCCLNVVGNTAYLSGEVVASNRDDIPIGTPFYTVVVDVSPDGAGDMVGPVYLTGLTCADVQPAEFQSLQGTWSSSSASRSQPRASALVRRD